MRTYTIEINIHKKNVRYFRQAALRQIPKGIGI